jgi:hypothetical protein
VPTKFATAVASPSTQAVDPVRTRRPENEEQSIHPLYSYLYVADKYEGLVVIGDPDPKSKRPGVSTLLDGNPQNNFLKRALACNRKSQQKSEHRSCKNPRVSPFNSAMPLWLTAAA